MRTVKILTISVHLKRLLAYLVLPAVAVFPLFMPITVLARDFPVYDALIYANKPDLTSEGLLRFKVVYDSDMWGPGESQARPNFRKIAAVAKRLNPQVPLCIDIEHWPTRGDAETVANSVANYRAVLDEFRRQLPKTVIGFYGMVPVNDYWRAIKGPGTNPHAEWLRENERLKEMVVGADAVYPSLYTFYPDRAGWEKYAVENLKEARKYGKPVYAFLWPEYHDSNSDYKGRNLPADFWRFELETCLKYADGIVIWGGWQKQWDENAPWWLETRKFLQQIQAQ